MKKDAQVVTESDVEQKRFLLFLTANEPLGLGYKTSHFKTKPDIRGFQIDKGESAKLYFPDYVLLSQGLPVAVAEIKKPGGDLSKAYREARLYAAEINAQYPAGINPVRYVIVSHDAQIRCGAWDELEPTHVAGFFDSADLNADLYAICEVVSASSIANWANSIRAKLAPRDVWKPTRLLGGQSVRNEEIAPNTFGTTLALEYKHIFNPTTREERKYVVQNAYIESRRRERYVDPIDKIIRAAAPPSETQATLIADTGQPREIINRLRNAHSLAHQVVLLVGGVGSGKSTFVDYLREVKLPADVRNSTIWLSLDMNFAPVAKDRIYDWVLDKLAKEFHAQLGNLDFDSLDVLQKLYAPELSAFKKGPLQLIPRETAEHGIRLADHLIKLQGDRQITANALFRFCASERGKLPIVLLDNCDKRLRDEQLLMFEVAQWLRTEFRTLVILPLRDDTYDNHRSEPPLDTAIKDLVFRIEPPLFSKVLVERIKLTLKQMAQNSGRTVKEYDLPNGMKVAYPTTELGFYLSSIVKSVFEYDRYVRRIVVGLAGRDLRKAMEIFLEFCTSGHINADEVFKIRQLEGKYTLPYSVVTRVLLRGNRRFYSSENSYIKNIFALEPGDTFPSPFARISILHWLGDRFTTEGPIKVRGYHRVATLKADLVPLGLTDEIIDRELRVLLRAGCVTSENFRTDVTDDDLVKLAPSGYVHRGLASDLNYLGSVAEDMWFRDETIANDIAQRIGDPTSHYRESTVLCNARDMATYLKEEFERKVTSADTYLAKNVFSPSKSIHGALNIALETTARTRAQDPWLAARDIYRPQSRVTGRATKLVQGGLLVELEPNVVGFLEDRGIKGDPAQYLGKSVEVVVNWVNETTRRIGLSIASS